ncbi:MAG: DUF4433 domain-containing protein [Muribaculaceae bacterium]|nr:DUF4433 domain-containing protein [Muribaculaceae bacterium]
MSKRSDIAEFLSILKIHGITKLYHFTDRDNLDSIVANGGLYSWADCEAKGIDIPKPGGSGFSRDLDIRDGLQNYVRLSFTTKHPMMFVAMNDGRISNPIILEIDLEIISDDSTKFADRNATKTGVIIGNDIETFKRIHFKSLKANTHFDLPPEEQMYFQAEVLVKNHIPLSAITNLSSYGVTPSKVAMQTPTRIPYTAQISRQTPTAFIFMVDHSVSMKRTIYWHGETITLSEAVARILNNQINELVLRCIKADDVRHYYDIAVIGYGHEVSSGWNGDLEGRWFVTPQELRDHPFRTITVWEEKRTRRGPVVKEVQKVLWVDADHTGNGTYLHNALDKAKCLLQEWMDEHRGLVCYPPTIINITDGAYNGAAEDIVEFKANELKSMSTDDGNVIFFNIHVTPNNSKNTLFPTESSEVGNSLLAKRLFNLSSLLPERYNDEINSIKRTDNGQRYRAMGVNVDMATLVKIMDIGTPTNIRNI